MEIASISYGRNRNGSVNSQRLVVLLSDETTVSVGWPCATWHRPYVQAWLDAGGTISGAA